MMDRFRPDSLLQMEKKNKNYEWKKEKIIPLRFMEEAEGRKQVRKFGQSSNSWIIFKRPVDH